jgi:hypothetical protein
LCAGEACVGTDDVDMDFDRFLLMIGFGMVVQDAASHLWFRQSRNERHNYTRGPVDVVFAAAKAVRRAGVMVGIRIDVFLSDVRSFLCFFEKQAANSKQQQ